MSFGVASNLTRPLPIGAELTVADNTGARVFRILGVPKYHSVRKRSPSAGVGSMVIGTAKKGKPEVMHQVLKAVIIRQKKAFMRPDGIRVKFADNACIIVDDDGKPKGTEIKGPVAKEVMEKWKLIGGSAKIVV